jgi:hypothetical protein
MAYLLRFSCFHCGVVAERPKQGRPKMCEPCSDEHVRRQQPAMSKVAAAVRRGELPQVKTLACADCGGPARSYDHRNYAKPLVVEPVCRSCNVKRGPAVWA